MSTVHPYIRYAQALIMVENELPNCESINAVHVISEIQKGLEAFRMKPSEHFEGKKEVKYDFCKIEKGNPARGIYLSPNVVSTDKQAGNLWKVAEELINALRTQLFEKPEDLNMSVAPTAGEYLSFSLKGGISRGKPRVSLKEQGLSAVTTLTVNKPSLQYRVDKKGKPELFNICIIPDLSIDKLMDYISLFKRMLKSKTASNLKVGNILAKSGKGTNATISYEPKRPLIFKGNFPNPPRSSALGSIAVLGAIGEFAKETEYSEQAKRVLESLKGSEIYMIRYGGASTFTYNHYVIDLAKAGKLKSIIDSLYYSQLYNQDRRTSTNTEYQKFDLFASRFLHLFNHAAFKDFLAFRAEYPSQVTILFNTYFIKMENIDPKIVASARALGKWLNKVAYFTAKSEIREGTPNYWEGLRTIKSKVLVELESSTFSSKSGDALIAQAVTRAGRLSGMDAPEAASLFMEKTASGELPLEKAKNLLIAFSRLINGTEKAEVKQNDDLDDDVDNENLEEI
ncbi:MAG: type I-PGING CRISPR-associated protein Cas8c/Csp2 [Prevotellaceae bacterium]|jgi:CRISPR-associated protein Cas8c/Csp2|nr:type I-PGING CRISPR-associated protein Cas8c/Csp2 [Prevotellaceae bacterium]